MQVEQWKTSGPPAFLLDRRNTFILGCSNKLYKFGKIIAFRLGSKMLHSLLKVGLCGIHNDQRQIVRSEQVFGTLGNMKIFFHQFSLNEQYKLRYISDSQIAFRSLSFDVDARIVYDCRRKQNHIYGRSPRSRGNLSLCRADEFVRKENSTMLMCQELSWE